MKLFQELRKRRVPQIVSSYVVVSWGLLQFLEFLEGRMAISAHLVNLVGLGLLLLAPAVLVTAWSLGSPGRDRIGRLPKVFLPANLIAAAILLAVMFSGKPLGAVTRTIAVQDEEGATTERVVPKSEFRRRVLVFYPENAGPAEDDWARETQAFLLFVDLNQDVFLEVMMPFGLAEAFERVGSPDGHGLTGSQRRTIARNAHYGHFVTSHVERGGKGWLLETKLHAAESGRVLASRDFEAESFFDLADQASLQLRKDLELPTAHIEESQDLPVSELYSENLEAVKLNVQATLAATHHNDWAGAAPLLEEAVALDPAFASAQFLRFAVNQTLGNREIAMEAITAAMENLYRLTERTSFLIKSQYYFDVVQDPDKAMAVLQMWSQIYPSDILAYTYRGIYLLIRNDVAGAIDAYEQILEIDPSQYRFLGELADLHQRLGQHDEAERYLLRYIDIFPARMDGYEDLSDLYTSIGRLEEARATLEKAQLLDPAAIDLALGLVDLDLRLGEFDSARAALTRELDRIETSRDRSKVHSRLMNLESLTGHPDAVVSAADSMYRAMLEFRNPLQVEVIMAMILPRLSTDGRPDEALERLRAARSRISKPFDKMTGASIARVLADLGRTDEARVALAEAVEIIDNLGYETLRPHVYLAEGRIAEIEGDLDLAIDRYRAAVEAAPQREPNFALPLARTLRLDGKRKESRELLDELLVRWPGLPEGYLELALLLEESGKIEEARGHLRHARSAWSDADPDFPAAARAAELAGRIDPSQ